MKIIKIDLSGDFSKALAEAVASLKLGGAVIYPTDTLYGLGANALEAGPVQRIFKIKKRPKSRPLPIAVRNINWAKELAFIYKKEEKILEAVWPGAVTAVLPKRSIAPDILTAGQNSIAMRIPDSLFIDELLGKFGYPITSTSANISGELPSFKISEIIERFENSEDKPDLVLDAGDLKQSEPSTILDLTSDKPKILRVGPSKPGTLLKLLEI